MAGAARVLTIWLIVGILSLLALVVRLPLVGQVELRVGDVASADVIAPRQVTYVSDSSDQTAPRSGCKRRP